MSQPPPSVAPPAPPAPSVPTTPCEACAQEFDLRAAACPRCGFPRTAAPNPFKKRSRKSPREAMWASLLWPGGGHFYAGDPNTGAILSVFAIVIIGLSATVLGPEIGLVFWLGLALRAAISSGKLISESLDR